MSDTPPPARYVTWDRWDAEHQRLREHEDAEHHRLDDRIDALMNVLRERREHRWNIEMVLLGSLIFPLLVLAVVAFVSALRLGG